MTAERDAEQDHHRMHGAQQTQKLTSRLRPRFLISQGPEE
jgi:hypothetical protein